MNHKLRVLVRVDIDPAQVTVEVTGCVTQSDSEALHHILRRAARVAAEANVILDLRGASHLDPEVLLDLRRMAAAGIRTGTNPAGTAAAGQHVRLTLEEPADLPICLLHVGAGGEVLADLESGLPAGSGGALVPAGAGPGRWAEVRPEEHLSLDLLGEPNDGLELSAYFEDTLDPAATVRALSDIALCRLADALFSHLDTARPSFGAHTWYELAAEEIQDRHLHYGDCVSGGTAEAKELTPGPATG
ncbi:hypothetical protein [Arthrobacter oryzae]|uniref:STAS domain-containing protein n=1 Tax=Arthrobacter oryzae TaxID=409290 RepID=A0A3N0BM64_9MICC|nr:hypothetical protein [Arthrobacter oryzae]RNL49826.1 hypothetical protein D7003_16930 [Arthrobacter oryzae]